MKIHEDGSGAKADQDVAALTAWPRSCAFLASMIRIRTGTCRGAFARG